MAFHYSPKIVTDGLEFYIDAANPKSFVDGNTTWNDLSRSGNNGTLTNGPTFDSANGGSISFDGVNDYVDMGAINFGQIYTLNIWVKLDDLSSRVWIGGVNTSEYHMNFLNGNSYGFLRFDGADRIEFFSYNDPNYLTVRTNRLFRDTSAWYHIVVKVDTTQATSSDRVKIYVNGVQETSFSTETYPSQNYDFILFDNSARIEMGARKTSSDVVEKYFDASMAHVHWIDGTAYDADTFGETDATTGIWKPKTAPSVTYGTNGFFLKFENSGAFGTDSSGNSNNWTVNGTMTQNIDTPSNVFATINSLDNLYTGGTLSNGNNKIVTGVAQEPVYINSTLGASSGKYYCEVKNLTPSGRGLTIGISGRFCSSSNDSLGSDLDGFGYTQTGNYRNNNTETAYGDTYTENDIIGIALDLDNNKLYFSKNGTWQNSGDPTSGATGTGALAITDPNDVPQGGYSPVGGAYTSVSHTLSFNFGQGYFGTTAVSSAQADDGGLGIMEYDVPANYRVLCTKNIKDYG